MPSTILLVIDIQSYLALNPSTQIPHATSLRTAGTSLLSSARSAIDTARAKQQQPSLEIIFVQHEETAEKGPLVRGSPAWELVFRPREGEMVVRKNIRDTFASNPELASQLRLKGVDTIVAFGVQSECCVLSTCKGALEAGFKVKLLKGAHSTYDFEGKKAEGIEREVEDEIRMGGGEVVDWKVWESFVSRGEEGS